MRCFSFLFFLFMLACSSHEEAFVPVTDDAEDVAYTRMLDSVEALLFYPYVVDTTDALITPALGFYQQDSTPHHLWMLSLIHI